jgi:hypothetical protein
MTESGKEVAQRTRKTCGRENEPWRMSTDLMKRHQFHVLCGLVASVMSKEEWRVAAPTTACAGVDADSLTQTGEAFSSATRVIPFMTASALLRSARRRPERSAGDASIPWAPRRPGTSGWSTFRCDVSSLCLGRSNGHVARRPQALDGIAGRQELHGGKAVVFQPA